MGVTTLDDAGAAYDPPNVPSLLASSSSSSSSPSPRETSRPVVPPRVFSSDRTTATNKTTENRFRVEEALLLLFRCVFRRCLLGTRPRECLFAGRRTDSKKVGARGKATVFNDIHVTPPWTRCRLSNGSYSRFERTLGQDTWEYVDGRVTQELFDFEPARRGGGQEKDVAAWRALDFLCFL